jgi:hypothetical protein
MQTARANARAVFARASKIQLRRNIMAKGKSHGFMVKGTSKHEGKKHKGGKRRGHKRGHKK